MMAFEEYKKLFHENGYVVINNLIHEAKIAPLRLACHRVTNKARNGEWKQTRVVGVQFPPWPETYEDIWGVENIMHPDLQEAIFAEVYASENLISFVKELLEVNEDQLQMELFNLLINPIHDDYALTWHRDAVEANVDEEKELQCLSLPHYGTQWNTALYPDYCLYVVPGSHKRVRTAEEREIQIHDPLSDKMPGAVCLRLDVGQTVFYNSNILHRGVYHRSEKRATLHGSMGCVEGAEQRSIWRTGHRMDWMREEKFRNTLPTRLQPLLVNLIKYAAN